MPFITAEPFVVLLNFIYTVNIITIPQLVLKKVCNEKYNSSICDQLGKFKHEQDIVQQISSVWVLILLLATLLPSMFAVLIWGPIADKIGRNRVILIPPVFFGLQSVIYLLNSTKFLSSSPVYLVIGSLCTSVFGDFQGAYAIAYSYMADITERNSKRTMRMAIVEGIMFFSGAPAGLASGFLLQKCGFGPVFISTLSMSVLMFIYVMFLLPKPNSFDESKEKGNTSNESRSSVKTDGNSIYGSDEAEVLPIVCRNVRRSGVTMQRLKYHLNPFNHLNTVFSVIKNRKSKGLLIALLVAFWIAIIAISGEIFITVLFIKHRPFNLSSEEVGYYLAFTSLSRGIGAVVLSQVAVRCLGLKDQTMILIGLVSQTSNYVLLAFSTSKTMLYLVTLSGIGVGVATSSMRSLITKQVPFDSHGSILAAIEFLDAFGALLANVLSNTIYKSTVSKFSGMAFLVLASFGSVSLIIVTCVCCSLRRKAESPRIRILENY